MRRNRGEYRALFFFAAVFRVLAELFFFALFEVEVFAAELLDLVAVDLGESDFVGAGGAASVPAD